MTFTDLRARIAREQRWLLLFLAATALAWSFAKLAGEMVDGETGGFDRSITLAFRVAGNPAQPIGPAWLPGVMIDLSALGSVVVLTLVSLLAVAALLLRQRWRLAAVMAAATGGGALASMMLKSLFGRARPDIVPQLVEVHSLSFPSSHATNSAIVYLTIAMVLARNFADRPTRLFILACAAGLVIVIGVTRVYLGVHYSSDVIAGWMAGSAWALAMGALCHPHELPHQTAAAEPPGRR